MEKYSCPSETKESGTQCWELCQSIEAELNTITHSSDYCENYSNWRSQLNSICINKTDPFPSETDYANQLLNRIDDLESEFCKPEFFTLNVELSPCEGGSVAFEPKPTTDGYEKDTVVTIFAYPEPNFNFLSFYEPASGKYIEEKIISVTMDRNIALIANFFRPRAELIRTVKPSEAGIINVEPWSESGLYYTNTELTLEAIPVDSDTWQFDRFESDTSGLFGSTNANPFSFTFTKDTSITAFFIPVNAELHFEIVGTYSSSNPATGRIDYPFNSTVRLEVNAETDWLFRHFEGENADDVVIIEGGEDQKHVTAEITMDEDKEVFAILSQTSVDRAFLTTQSLPSQGGAVVATPSQEPHGYIVGTAVTVTATPNSDWNFDRFKITVEEESFVSNANPYVFAIQADTSVTAFFVPPNVELIFNQTGCVYTKSPEDSNTIHSKNSTITLFVAWQYPDKFSHVSGVDADDVYDITENSYTIGGIKLESVTAKIDMDSNKDILFTHKEEGEIPPEEEPDRFRLGVFVPEEGSLDISPPQPVVGYQEDTLITLTATVNSPSLFEFNSFEINGSSVPSNPFSFFISENTTVRVHFTPFRASLSVSDQGGGSVSVSPSQPSEGFAVSTTVTLEAVADNGWLFHHYEFSFVTRPDAETSLNPLSFNIDQDTEVSAIFFPEEATLSYSVQGNYLNAAPLGDTIFSIGKLVSLSVECTSPWVFDRWGGPDGYRVSTTDGGSDESFATGQIQIGGDYIVIAILKKYFSISLEITPCEAGSASISPSSLKGYITGTEVKATAAPNCGWEFDHFSLSTGTSTCQNPYPFSMPNTDVVITAHFAKTSYELSFSVSGCVHDKQPAATTIWSAETEVTLTVIWAPGEEFDSFSGYNSSDIYNLTTGYYDSGGNRYYWSSAMIRMNSDKSVTFNSKKIAAESTKKPSIQTPSIQTPSKPFPVDVLIPMADGEFLDHRVLTALSEQINIITRLQIRTRPRDKKDRVYSIIENRNALVQLVKNDLVFFLDSDVILSSKNTISNCINFLKTHPNHAAVACPINSSMNSKSHFSLQATAIRREVLLKFPFRYDGKGCECYNFTHDLEQSDWEFSYLKDVKKAIHLKGIS